MPNREDQVKFLNSILLGAVREWLDMGVLWQVTMAQAAQEIGWGETAIIDMMHREIMVIILNTGNQRDFS